MKTQTPIQFSRRHFTQSAVAAVICTAFVGTALALINLKRRRHAMRSAPLSIDYVGAALLFGTVQSMQLAVRISPPAGDLGAIVSTIPPQIFGMLPYIFTIIVLAGVVGRAIPPAADGIPYDKEARG